VCLCVLFLREQARDLRVQVLEGARCRCCGTKRSFGILLVKILHSGEGGGVEQVCSNLETILSCLRLFISLSLVVLYLAFLYCLHHYMLDIFVLYWIYAWDCLLTLVFNQESHSGTSTLNLEESWGDSLEPFTENLATLFGYTLCVSLIVFRLRN